MYKVYMPLVLGIGNYPVEQSSKDTETGHANSLETNLEADLMAEDNAESGDSFQVTASGQATGLQYFGYHHGATFLGNFMADFKDHANLVMVNSADSTLLTQAQNSGMKAIMDVGNDFFVKDLNTPCTPIPGRTTTRMVLRPASDYTARWNAIKNNVIGSNAGVVVAFYTLDEPYWHCASKSDLETVANIIKASYPTKKIMVTFAEPMVPAANFAIPQNHDWISFDYYGDFTPIPQLFQLIKSKLNATQKIMLTADGVAFSPTPPDIQPQLQIVARAHQYFELARANPDTVVGLLTFLWPSVHNEEHLIGVKEMPLVAQEYRCIGTYITRGSWCQDTVLSTNKPVSASNGSASARLVVNGNLTDAWNAQQYAPQWVTIDLKNEYPVTRIRLHVDQAPAGNTTHEIWVAGNDQAYQKVATITGNTQSGQILEHIFAPKRDGVRYVKIQTVNSPSWVAWREIQVLGPKIGTLVSQGKAASASRSHPSAPPSLAVNGNTTDGGWNAGDVASQWIQVDLGQSTNVSAIKLYVNQSCNGSPTCYTQHELWITNPYGTSTFVGAFNGTTVDRQILEKRFWPPLLDVRYVRIVTTLSASWVSWDEVQVYRAQ
jgi:hypothetical protein